MSEQPSSNSLLLQRLRTWPLGEIGKQAADEIERLSQDLAREVGTRSARVAEIDGLRQRVAEMERVKRVQETVIHGLNKQLDGAQSEPPAAHPFGNGTRESLQAAILSLRLARNNGDADQVQAVLDWIGPDTRSRTSQPPADAPRPIWSEALQDDIYYASDIDPYIDRLRAASPPSDALQAHIDYHYSQEAAAESTGAVASERFHRKSAEYLEKIKRGEPPGESPTKEETPGERDE